MISKEDFFDYMARLELFSRWCSILSDNGVDADPHADIFVLAEEMLVKLVGEEHMQLIEHFIYEADWGDSAHDARVVLEDGSEVFLTDVGVLWDVINAKY